MGTGRDTATRGTATEGGPRPEGKAPPRGSAAGPGPRGRSRRTPADGCGNQGMSPSGTLHPHGWSGRARHVSKRRPQPFAPERVPRAPAWRTRGARGSQGRQEPGERRTCRAQACRGPRQRSSRRGPPGGARPAKPGSSGHLTSPLPKPVQPTPRRKPGRPRWSCGRRRSAWRQQRGKAARLGIARPLECRRLPVLLIVVQL